MRLYPDERLIAAVSFIPIIENLHCWSAKVQITYLQLETQNLHKVAIFHEVAL